MEQQGNHIVFQCYGNEDIFRECAFALLSLSRLYETKQLSDTQVWLYTDNAKWFERFDKCPLPLWYRKIDEPLIKKWKGEIDFVHRVKIEVLRHFTKNATGNVLYLDTDIVFLQPLAKVWEGIAAGKLYMHTMEGYVSDESNPILRKLSVFLKRDNLKMANGSPANEAAMWNAGALGFNTSHANLLEDVLQFTDTVYPKFRKHIVEQFAFSLYFQQADDIKTAMPYILHYWNVKEVREILVIFFNHFKNASWEELTYYSNLIQLTALMQEKINFLRNQGIIQKSTWHPPAYQWDELVKQL